MTPRPELTEESIATLEKWAISLMQVNISVFVNERANAVLLLTNYWRENESLANKLKAELAYVCFQRDALLEMTWLDLPSEPSESIAMWRKLFEEGWERKPEKEPEQVPKEPLCKHCGFPYGHHQMRGGIAYCLPSPSWTSWESAAVAKEWEQAPKDPVCVHCGYPKYGHPFIHSFVPAP